MATPSAVLSVVVDANTTQATAKLTKFEGQLKAANETAKRGVEARLGGNFNGAAFDKYQAATRRAAAVARDRAAFKAELGANFSASGFRAYQRELRKTEVQTTESTRKMHDGWLGAAKGVLAFAGAFAAFDAVKRAVDTTLELGRATHQLSAVTGMDNKTTSQWIELFKVREVQGQQVSQGFITLARNIKAAEQGTKKATGTFKELGVSFDAVKRGDIQEVLLQSADGFAKLRNPAIRAADAQQLFGKNARSLLPLLSEGRKGVEDALAATQKYGAYLPKSAKAAEGARIAQRNLKLAMDGLRISVGTALLPILVKVAGALVKFIGQMRSGKGAGGELARIIRDIVKFIEPLWKFVERNAKAFEILAVAIGGTVVAFKLLSAALDLITADPILLALVALAVGLIIAYKKVKWFRDAVDAAWKWIKNATTNVVHALVDAWHWFAKYIVPIFANAFNTIKNLVKDAFRILKGIFEFFSGLFTLNFSKMWKGIKDIFGGALSGIIDLIKGEITHVYDVGKAFISAFGNGIKDAGILVANAIIGVFQTLLTPINDAIKLYNKLPGWLKVAGQIDPIKIPTIGGGGGGGDSSAGPVNAGKNPATIRAALAASARQTAPASRAAASTRRTRATAASTTASALGWPTTAATPFPALALVPSQTTGRQVAATQLANQLQAAQNRGDTAGARRIETEQTRQWRQWLTLDRAQLARINRTLGRGHLTRVQHGTLMADQLAVVQEIGTVLGDIGGVTTTNARATTRVRTAAARAARAARTRAARARAARARAARAARAIAPFATIPSQTARQQILAQQIANRITVAQGRGDTGAQGNAEAAQKRLWQRWLNADQAKLGKVNRALARKGLSTASRNTLIQDKLALLQEIGSIQSNLGSASSNADTSSGTASGGFDLAPTGGSQLAMPSLYDVRTTVGRQAHEVHHHGNVVVHVHQDADVHKVADAIDRVTGSRLHAQIRRAGLRGT